MSQRGRKKREGVKEVEKDVDTGPPPTAVYTMPHTPPTTPALAPHTQHTQEAPPGAVN